MNLKTYYKRFNNLNLKSKEQFSYFFKQNLVKQSETSIGGHFPHFKCQVDNYVNNNFKDHEFKNYSEKIFIFINSISKIPLCKKCQEKKVNFKQYSHGYFEYCSTMCSAGSEEKKKTIANTNLEKYGVANVSEIDEIKKKKKETTFENFGVDHHSKSEYNKEKIKITSRKRYGSDHFFSSKEGKNKIKEIVFEKFGVESNLLLPEVREKIAKTNIEKYGTYNFFGSPKGKEAVKNGVLAKYGVENISQSIEHHEKAMKSGMRAKEFIFPSGKIVKVRGYEPQALEYLLKTYKEDNIIAEVKEINKLVGEIWYIGDDGKQKRYYPDIFIISENRLIDVKSTYTFSVDFDKNKKKKQACIDKGHNFQFIVVYGKKADKVKII